MPPKEAIIWAKTLYDKMLDNISRVQEDDLQDLNIGTTEEPKMVKDNVNLDKTFKMQLTDLLREFKDVFAWDYLDLRGMDPKIYKHQINSKEDARPIIHQRY